MSDARCSADGCWYTLPVVDGLIVAHSKAGTLDVCEGGGRPPLEPEPNYMLLAIADDFLAEHPDDFDELAPSTVYDWLVGKAHEVGE